MTHGDRPAPAAHRLTLVPTPIGNLGDVTVRALDVLRAADVVAAEDTRRSRTLLDRYTITTPLVRLDAHTMSARAPRLLEEHAHMAFVTDAGSPGISDPGADLVRIALRQGVHVEALPGPTAFVPALVLSGLSVARFTFEGFLPRRGGARRERLEAIARRDHTSVVYESPHRLAATLGDLAVTCGARRSAAVARELTKRFETVERGTLEELRVLFEATPALGEIVIVVEGADLAEATAGGGASGADAEVRADPVAAAEALAARGLRGRDLLQALLERGVARPQAYRLSVRHKRDVGDDEG
ncbi:16S rRNA (cytidine(1402)-2'-O)-methyltransferase [soil metagenome]|nr:16S rRNA (cytidine(1402)-2'-O)-methyltransferase [Trueperaceae bacterium]